MPAVNMRSVFVRTTRPGRIIYSSVGTGGGVQPVAICLRLFANAVHVRIYLLGDARGSACGFDWCSFLNVPCSIECGRRML